MADHGFSERRACRLIGVNRSAWQYEPLRGKDDAVRVRMREIANERRRFGYRRLAILLAREGKGMNLKKVYRLYREERLTVRKDPHTEGTEADIEAQTQMLFDVRRDLDTAIDVLNFPP